MRQLFLKRANPNHRKLVGFTLVEMLVAVTLVLLMMTMFAQIFQMATGALSTQKGISENDQKARMLNAVLRGDLDHRTFRDVFPFRSNEDTRQLGHSLSRRAGYVEIDEGDPTSDIDDVLQFTAFMNIRLQNKDTTPFVGRALPMSARSISSLTGSSIQVAGDVTSLIQGRIWIFGSMGPNRQTNDGRYQFLSATFSSGVTTINFASNSFTTAALNPSPASPDLGWGYVSLSENDPDFDDGVYGNSTSTSCAAEICYFLRSGILYRRVLLIRDPAVGSDAQPKYTTGTPLLWNGTGEFYTTAPISGNASTFWRDFDYSAFYFAGKNLSIAPGVHFHAATESLSNSSQAPLILINDSVSPVQTFPISLGVPNLRFGHSLNGFTQDASTSAFLTTGQAVTLNRFTLQECSNTAFGYPGYLPNDPVSGTANTSPFDRTNIQVDPNTGLVVEYSNQVARRGEDILMSNVLTFDVKVWDPIYRGFVDIGDSTLNPGGPFSSTAAGLLNSAYGGTSGHFRFDTWHPLASVGTGPTAGEPPYVPLDAANRPFPLSAIQITINYRDVSSGQVRQMTLVQSLVDRVKPSALTNEAPEE